MSEADKGFSNPRKYGKIVGFGSDFDTPNAEMKRPSKEMEATRRYIPKRTVIEAGKIREI